MKCGLVLEFYAENDKVTNFYFIPKFDDTAILSFLATYRFTKGTSDFSKTYPVGCLTMLRFPIKHKDKIINKAKEFAESHNFKITGEDVYEIILTFTNRTQVKFIVLEVET